MCTSTRRAGFYNFVSATSAWFSIAIVHPKKICVVPLFSAAIQKIAECRAAMFEGFLENFWDTMKQFFLFFFGYRADAASWFYAGAEAHFVYINIAEAGD